MGVAFEHLGDVLLARSHLDSADHDCGELDKGSRVLGREMRGDCRECGGGLDSLSKANNAKLLFS